MSGIIGTNSGRGSGSIGTAAAGPTVSSSNPAIDTNVELGTQWANSTSGNFYVMTDSTTNENVWTNVGDGTGSIAPIPYVGSRGVFAGARAYTNEIEYVTIASDGNGTDFGDLSVNTAIHGGGSNVTRGIFGLDRTSGGASNVIEYITVGSTGNSTDFGDATITKQDRGSASNGTRFVMAGGYPSYNNIDYVTIASTGNATDFGDLTVGRQAVGAVSSETRMCFAGGETSP
jgi:hypothetical protein